MSGSRRVTGAQSGSGEPGGGGTRRGERLEGRLITEPEERFSVRSKASKSRAVSGGTVFGREAAGSTNGMGATLPYEGRWLHGGRISLDGRILDVACGMKQARKPVSGANRREAEKA
jgi:hypothetical protein